jgi:hypothetical protein
MPDRLAILACGGALPVRLAAAYPEAVRVGLSGIPNDLNGDVDLHRLEKLGTLFDALKAQGVGRIVLAGALARPAFDPSAFDATMVAVAPRLMAAMQEGDDGLLGTVIAIFEEQGFVVVGAHELLPDLVAEAGLQVGPPPSDADLRDATRAWDILGALSPLDVGQGAVVAGGQCLGIETVQGTDAMLRFVAETPAELRRGVRGVYVKAAKRGQDLRVDMPAVGPRTVAAVAGAGLSGLVIEPGRVMILDREETLQAALDAGVFLSARSL